MNQRLIEQQINCPFCGERITVMIDPSEELQLYTEDCSVCCNPMSLSVWVRGDDNIEIRVEKENE